MAGKAPREENLSDSNIQRVISLLEAEKPITKKAACEILNISYNTTRLASIVQKYKDKVKHDEEQRARKRGTPATEDEISYVVTSYLQGASVAEISRRTYRSVDFVDKVLSRVNCPRRSPAADYFKPELIPEFCIKEKYNIGERVWAARYNSLAVVKSEKDGQPGVYSIWLEAENWQQYAYQPWWELANLDHIKKYLI